MIRTKGQFYWSDALYLARGRDALIQVDTLDNGTLFQCVSCRAFVIFDNRGGGTWVRLRPFVHHRHEKKYAVGQTTRSESNMEVLSQSKKTLCRCKVCASHWWKEAEEWTKADDGMIDRSNT